VRDPDGYELYITVNFSRRAEVEVIHHSCGRITFDSSFWVCAAERHLAEYLWKHDDFPPDEKLNVDELTIEDMDSARRWGAS
jgi:hypothetical protein